MVLFQNFKLSSLGTLLFDQSKNYKISRSYYYVLAYKIWWESNIPFDSYEMSKFELWAFFLATLLIFRKNRPRRLTFIFKDLYKLQKDWSKNLYSDLLFEKVGQKKHVFLDFLATLPTDFSQNLISCAIPANTFLCQISWQSDTPFESYGAHRQHCPPQKNKIF